MRILVPAMTSTIARPEPAHDEVLAQLNRILADARFAASERNSRFLRYVVERTLAGKAAEIKEIVIATELYGRSGDYDPKADSIVRVEASRLRSKLHSYYTEQGAQDPIRITIPKGTYVPQFERRPQEGPPDGVVPANRQEMQQAIKRWPWAALIFVAS